MPYDYEQIANEIAGPDAREDVRAAAEMLHYNESLHMHDLPATGLCSYCWLRAGRAVKALRLLAEVRQAEADRASTAQWAISFTGDRHYRGGWTKDAVWQGPFATRKEAEDFRKTAGEVGRGDEVILQRATPRSKWRIAPGQTYRDTVDCPTGYDDCQECDGQGHRTHQVEATA